MIVFTPSPVETLASGGVTSAGEDARTLTDRRVGELTTGSYNNKIITLLHTKTVLHVLSEHELTFAWSLVFVKF